MFDNWERKIIEESLKGYTEEKTAEMVNVTPYDVKRVMKKLREYEPEVFNRILMERALNKKIVNKDLLEFFEAEINLGKSCLEISYDLEKSEEYKDENDKPYVFTDADIKEYLKDILTLNAAFKNIEYYKELTKKLEENNQQRGLQTFVNFLEKNIDCSRYLSPYAYKIYENTLKKRKMVKELESLPEHTGTNELAQKYGLMSSAVREILLGNDKEELLKKYYGQEQARRIIDSYENRVAFSKKKNKEKVALKYRDEGLSEHDYKVIKYLRANQEVILKMILQFRLSLDGIAKLFDFEKKEALKKEILHLAGLQTIGDEFENAIRYALFNYYHDLYSDKEVAKEKESENYSKAAAYMKKYLQAQKANDKSLQELYNQIDDVEYKKILEKRNHSFSELTPQEKEVVIKYRIKYLLPYRKMPFSHTTMIRNVPKDFQEQWDLVNEYNTAMAVNDFRSRNTKR